MRHSRESLATYQARFVKAVETGEPEEGSPAGMEVYVQAFRERMTEAMVQDFPSVAERAGTGRFRELVLTYVREARVQSFTLAMLGAGFSEFLEGEREGELATLARLDWARCRAWEAADSPDFPVERARALSERDWARASLIPAPSVVFVGKTVVWKTHDGLQDRTMWKDEATAFQILTSGRPMGGVLNSTVGEIAILQDKIQTWIQNWIQAGLIVDFKVQEGETSL